MVSGLSYDVPVGIKEVISVINEMQAAGVIDRYAIGGAVAATFYLEPISTLDVDVFVTFSPVPGSLLISLQPIYDYLKAQGCTVEDEHIVIGDWPVQFLPPTGPLVEEALADAETGDVEDTPVRVFSREHLAAIALQTGRAKDKARLLQFTEDEDFDLARFQAIVGRHGLGAAWQRFEQQFLSDRP